MKLSVVDAPTARSSKAPFGS
ncbi:hypothetical protein R2601_04618 [Salipiger bermudensis HTCC2601]|uniref:Uncharacterized protein n=1 Tax=Salipiger bermudensis (strain DSM 26914 / JCM 13377 / KCTC 12554 / HTCC2601) TaxID=314265 RepID=Q0FVS2_SALBH|nr:hypothetical protein R2601_04618 [Salipiger bermudensis HTCC2601]